MKIYGKLANLFEYPEPGIIFDHLDECQALGSGEMQSLFQAFRGQLDQMGIPHLQELYVETFDFHAETSPYVGHHLFGEEIRRNLFMAQLRGRYRESGFADTTELPDHLTNVLRFLTAIGTGEEQTELIHRCLIPALRHMLRALKPDNPYTLLFEAILLAFRQEDTSVLADGEIEWKPFSSLSSPTSR